MSALSNEVTEVITTDVKAGQESAYRDWADRVEAAQRAFDGYLGSFVQPPGDGQQAWTTLMRFDSVEHLQTWMNSPQRASLLKEREDLVEREMLHQLSNSFPGWIPNNPATGKPPSKWMTASLVLLTLYPVIMLELKFLNPVLRHYALHPAIATFLGNSISVIVTTWPLMPLAIRAFSWWLFPTEQTPSYLKWVGALVVAACYGLEILLLWNLLP